MYKKRAYRKGTNAMGRNDENNYTLRPLTIDDAEEYNALLRYAFQVTEQELAETGWKDDEITQSKFPVLLRADVLGCFNGNDLIAQFAVYPLDMNIYGVKYSVGFVTSVCTYPEYTGHGIMKRLMIQSLIRMRDAHKSFALLYPYSIPLYRGLGWEIISNKMTYTIKDTQIPRKLNEPVMSDEFHGTTKNLKSFIPNLLKRHMAVYIETTLHGKNTGDGTRTTHLLPSIILRKMYLTDIWYT